MSSDLCDSLGANQQLHWYCSKCNSGVGKLTQEVRKIQDRLDAIEECLKKNQIDRSKEQSKSSLKLANIEGELLHLWQGISNHQEELEVMKVTLNEIQKRPTLEELIYPAEDVTIHLQYLLISMMNYFALSICQSGFFSGILQ